MEHYLSDGLYDGQVAGLKESEFLAGLSKIFRFKVITRGGIEPIFPIGGIEIHPLVGGRVRFLWDVSDSLSSSPSPNIVTSVWVNGAKRWEAAGIHEAALVNGFGQCDCPDGRHIWSVCIVSASGGISSTQDSFYVASICEVNPPNVTAAPAGHHLSQNYPNPFNPKTVIEYSIPKPCEVKLTVYNLLGQQVATLVNEHQVANAYKVTWDAKRLPDGVYFYKLEAGGEFATIKKMTLMK